MFNPTEISQLVKELIIANWRLYDYGGEYGRLEKIFK